MMDLVRLGALSGERTLRTARTIRDNNPLHIKDSILEEFIRKVAEFG
jgi:hypothetical protein